MTASARRRPESGSRSRPRGSRCPSPQGSVASTRTRSRSRCKRRCWKPSSRTSRSLSSSSTAVRAMRGAVGVLQVRHVGQRLLEHERLVVAAGLGAVAAAEDGDLPVAVAVEAGDPLDARRLAGAADGEVADADDRHADADDLAPAAARRPGCGPARRPRRATRRPAGRAARASRRGPRRSPRTSARKRSFAGRGRGWCGVRFIDGGPSPAGLSRGRPRASCSADCGRGAVGRKSVGWL